MDNEKLLSIGLVAREVGISKNSLKSSKIYKPFIVAIEGYRFIKKSDLEEVRAIAEVNKARYRQIMEGRQ